MVDRRTPNVVFPSLRDRVAIITGAGQGLGCAFAKGFAAVGAIAIIAERNGERGEAVAGEIAAGARRRPTGKLQYRSPVFATPAVNRRSSSAPRVAGRHAEIFPVQQAIGGEWYDTSPLVRGLCLSTRAARRSTVSTLLTRVLAC